MLTAEQAVEQATNNLAVKASDEELVASARSGDQESFAVLVVRHQHSVHAIAYCVCGDAEIAADIAQDALVKAWTDLASLEEPARFASWVGGIARNLGRNDRRKSARRRHEDADAVVIAAASDPEAEAAQRETECALWNAISELKTNFREPLVLFYQEGQSVGAVATALGLSEEAVKQRLSRGRRVLGAKLEQFAGEFLPRVRPTAAFTAAVLVAMGALPGASAAASVAPSVSPSPASSPAPTSTNAVSARRGILGGKVALVLGVTLTAAVVMAVVALVLSKRSGDSALDNSSVSKPALSTVNNAERPALAPSSAPAALAEVATKVFDVTDPRMEIEVVDIFGGPIADARITLDGDEFGVTDSDGVLALPTSAPTLRTMIVSAQGYAPRETFLSSFGHTRITLIPESTISGRVISGVTHKPLARITVSLGDSEATTDKRGAFSFAQLAPTRHGLRATGAGHASRETVTVDLGLHENKTGIDVAVWPGVGVSGVVKGSGPLPEGVIVTLGKLDKAELSNHSPAVANKFALLPSVRYSSRRTSHKLGADGAFSFEGVEAGRYELYLSGGRKGRELAGKPIAITVAGRDLSGITLLAPALARTEVIVMTTDGEPVVGQDVDGFVHGNGDSITGLSCETDDTGSCVLQAAKATFEVRDSLLARSGAAEWKAGKKFVLGDVATITIVIPAPGAIEGTLTNRGSGWGERVLWLVPKDASEFKGRYIASTNTDQAGRFAFANLPAGRYTVKAFSIHRDWMKMLFVSDVPAVAIADVLVRGGDVPRVDLAASVEISTLSGIVRDDRGNPVADALVTYVPQSKGMSTTRVSRFGNGLDTVSTNERGGFALTDVPADQHYLVFAQAPNGDSAQAESVSPGKSLYLTLAAPIGGLDVERLKRRHEIMSKIEAIHNAAKKRESHD